MIVVSVFLPNVVTRNISTSSLLGIFQWVTIYDRTDWRITNSRRTSYHGAKSDLLERGPSRRQASQRESTLLMTIKYMREILEDGLAAQGFPVRTFDDGDAFLQATTERIPICVFLDVVMPRRSGLEILQELRVRRYWTPVFLTSARADVQTVVEAMKNGAHDYIPKPFDPCALLPRVHNAVEMWLQSSGNAGRPGHFGEREPRMVSLNAQRKGNASAHAVDGNLTRETCHICFLKFPMVSFCLTHRGRKEAGGA